MTRLLTVDDLAPPSPLIQEGLIHDAEVLHRLARRNAKVPRPLWFVDPGWAFPTWCARKRPFDWQHDAADLPATPPPPAPYPEQARLRLYLRPPAPVVRA